MARRIDMAVADAVLERNAPLPAGWARGRAGDLLAVAAERAGNGDRAVARQPVGPVDEIDPEGLPEQQRTEARTVDEEIALDPRPAIEREAGDETPCPLLLDRDDASLVAREPKSNRLNSSKQVASLSP